MAQLSWWEVTGLLACRRGHQHLQQRASILDRGVMCAPVTSSSAVPTVCRDAASWTEAGKLRSRCVAPSGAYLDGLPVKLQGHLKIEQRFPGLSEKEGASFLTLTHAMIKCEVAGSVSTFSRCAQTECSISLTVDMDLT